MKPFAQFFRNITKTVSASGIQFLITLCATPVMTRLYEPSAYATFGIINTAATVIIGVGLLSLPNAYCAEKNKQIRAEIIQTMLVLLMMLTALTGVGAAIIKMVDVGHGGMDIPGVALALLPLLVMTYGVRQIMVNMAIQRASFTRLSLGQVIEPITSRGGSIALGALLGGNPSYILLSVLAGHISTALLLIGIVPKKLHTQWRLVIAHLPRMVANLRRYGDFVVYGTLSQQAPQVVMLGLQLSIAAFFSTDLAGHYILAVSILTLPVALIALSTAPVVYHHFIETERSSPAALPRHYIVATALYLLAGLVVLLPIFLFGEEIFTFAFGDVWAHAGRISAVLSLSYVGTFALTGVQSIFMVTRRLKLQFLLEIGTCVPTLIAAIYCFKTMDFDNAILYLSCIWFVRTVVLLVAALLAACQHPPETSVAA